MNEKQSPRSNDQESKKIKAKSREIMWPPPAVQSSASSTATAATSLLFPRPPSARAVNQLARNQSFRHALIPNVRITLHLRRGHARHRAPTSHFDLQPQLIPRTNRLPELSPLNPGKNHQLAAAIFHLGQQQRSARLCNGFHDQHARHNGQLRKMSREKRFVDGHVLNGNNALPALQLKHAVNQQERIAVRQDF